MDIELAKQIRAAVMAAEESPPASMGRYTLEFVFAVPDAPGRLRTLASMESRVPLHVPRVGEGVLLCFAELACTAVATEYRVEAGVLHQLSTVTVDTPAGAASG